MNQFSSVEEIGVVIIIHKDIADDMLLMQYIEDISDVSLSIYFFTIPCGPPSTYKSRLPI